MKPEGEDIMKKGFEGLGKKETEAQIKARMIKENRRNVQKSYLRQLDEKILDVEEGFLTKADLDNMSSDALDSLRRNVDPHGMHKHFGSEEIGKIDDFASGGLARVGFKKGTTRSRLQKDWESYATLKDLLYGSPPVAWVSPDKWSSQRDDEITRLKERFMYGEPTLKKDFSILDELKEDPTLEKIKAWLKERKEKASGGIAGQLHLNRPGYESGLKVLPKAEITQSSFTPVEGIDVSERDITYGGSGLYQGDKWYGGGDYMTGNVNVNVQEDGNTVFQDTMSKDDLYNLYIGLGQKEGDRVEVGTDTKGNYTFNIVKSFNQGGRASLSNGGLANILGV